MDVIWCHWLSTFHLLIGRRIFSCLNCNSLRILPWDKVLKKQQFWSAILVSNFGQLFFLLRQLIREKVRQKYWPVGSERVKKIYIGIEIFFLMGLPISDRRETHHKDMAAGQASEAMSVWFDRNSVIKAVSACTPTSGRLTKTTQWICRRCLGPEQAEQR